MAYFIRLESKDDIDFLQTILGNGVKKLKAGGSSLEGAASQIVNCYEAVINAVPAKEAERLGITAEEFPDDIKVKGKKKKASDEYIPNLCPNHPKNEFKRSPRTDCEGCWEAYKRLHPLEYDLARRKFERKNS